METSNKMIIEKVLSLIMTFFLFSSCNKTPKETYLSENVTAIAFDEKQKMIDFVHILPTDDIKRIEFIAPNNGQNIYVQIVGSNVYDNSLKNFLVSSRSQKGFAGKVKVDVKNGKVINVEGNGILYKTFLTLEQEKKIAKKIKNKVFTKIIRKDKYASNLKIDKNNNKTYVGITQKERKFVEKIFAYFKKKI